MKQEQNDNSFRSENDRKDNRKKEFLGKLTEMRKKKGWSIYRMAKETGIDRSYLLRLERGDISVGLDQLINLCDSLECKLDIQEY